MGTSLPLIAGIGEGAVRGIGAVGQARAIREQARFEDEAAAWQQQVLEFQIQDAIKRGGMAEQRERQRARVTIGAQRAAFAAQGIEVDVGSAREIQGETRTLGTMNAITIRNNAARQILGLQLAREDITTRRILGRLAAKTRERATILTGGLQAVRAVGGGAERTLFLESMSATDPGLEFGRPLTPGERVARQAGEAAARRVAVRPRIRRG